MPYHSKSSTILFLLLLFIHASTHPFTYPPHPSINPIKLYSVSSWCQALYWVLRMYCNPNRSSLSSPEFVDWSLVSVKHSVPLTFVLSINCDFALVLKILWLGLSPHPHPHPQVSSYIIKPFSQPRDSFHSFAYAFNHVLNIFIQSLPSYRLDTLIFFTGFLISSWISCFPTWQLRGPEVFSWYKHVVLKCAISRHKK